MKIISKKPRNFILITKNVELRGWVQLYMQTEL